jgi:ABC-type multidrug transport system fused ATPase/permease subunit
LKNILKIIRWLAKQARPYLFPIMLITLIGAVSSLVSVGMAFASKSLVDAASSLDKESVIRAAVLFSVFILTEIAMGSFHSHISVKTSEKMSNSVRENIFRRISTASWHKITGYHSDDVLARMSEDVNIALSVVISTLPSVVSLSVLLIAAFTALFMFDPLLALLSFVSGPLFILAGRLLASRLGKLHTDSQEAEAKTRGFIHEAIQNITVIKAFRLEGKSLSVIKRLQSDKTGLILKTNKLGIFSNIILSMGYWVGYLLAFGWGAFRLAEGLISFGTLVAFIQLVGQVQSPISGLAHSLPAIISSAASAKRLMELEELEQETAAGTAPDFNRCGVFFENVCFGYNGNNSILDDVSFKVLPGETACLMGTSGEGKTTILRLILALLKPDTGHIYITGENGERVEADASCRSLLSYVPQDNNLFSGTIAENLRMGNENASDVELKTAAIMADAWDFINELPDGLNTAIGEHGTGLSEGQAQRLAIARAFLNRTPILLLDEATSALDMGTEMKILEAVKQMRPERTCIIVTHRTSALEICDRILTLDECKVR